MKTIHKASQSFFCSQATLLPEEELIHFHWLCYGFIWRHHLRDKVLCDLASFRETIVASIRYRITVFWTNESVENQLRCTAEIVTELRFVAKSIALAHMDELVEAGLTFWFLIAFLRCSISSGVGQWETLEHWGAKLIWKLLSDGFKVRRLTDFTCELFYCHNFL